MTGTALAQVGEVPAALLNAKRLEINSSTLVPVLTDPVQRCWARRRECPTVIADMTEPQRETAPLLTSVRRALDDPSASLTFWRSGVDFWADLVETRGVVAVLRSPRVERFETSYDGLVEFGAIIEKEIRALRLMADADIPVPAVVCHYRAHLPGGDLLGCCLSWSSTRRIHRSRKEQLGTLTRRLHAVHPNSR